MYIGSSFFFIKKVKGKPMFHYIKVEQEGRNAYGKMQQRKTGG